MNGNPSVVLDYIDGIEINHKWRPVQNYHTILQIKFGIEHLYLRMKNIEKNYLSKNYPGELEWAAYFFEVNNPDAFMSVNLHLWYSTSLLNYAKSCALIKFLYKKKIIPEQMAKNEPLIEEFKNYRNNYVNSIKELIEVKHFRNKAGAHLAFTDPRGSDDNVATLEQSIAILPSFIHGRFEMGYYNYSKGENASSFGQNTWCLTKNFESLAERYFPNYIEKEA